MFYILAAFLLLLVYLFKNYIAILVLNKQFAGYVEKLDFSQITWGYWLGGDVVLHRLILKQYAFNAINLPVNIVVCHVDELVLRIPWTKLFSSARIIPATIRGLHLLAIPDDIVAFNPDKEKIFHKEAKAKQMALIEAAGDSPDKPEDDGFVAKVVAQILQLNRPVTIEVIEDMHIRYEDHITNAQRPFAVGITLKKLALGNADSSWNPTVASESSQQLFRLLSLDSLSIYCLSNASQLLCKMTPREQVEHFRNGIADACSRPYGNAYIMGPFTSYAKLKINYRPELDGSNFTIPKIFLNLTVEDISMGLTPHQYEDVVLLLNNLERMNRAVPYRKYRPVITSYKKNAKIWWLFAYQCVLEENVLRRRRNWRWSHMKRHRDIVRNYITLYKAKLTQKKEDPKLKKNLEELEENLDVFNITLARRQAEVQVDRMRTELRLKEKADAKLGRREWFGGWFGRGTASAAQAEDESSSVVKSLQAEMTPAEKAKLYSAIGYEENAVPAIYPKSFVENRFEFSLKKLEILLHDLTNDTQPIILLSSLSKVEVTVEQRPVAQALHVAVKVGDFTIDGSCLHHETPHLVRPLQADQEILTLVFETNPMDESCNQRIRLSAEPLLISYDAYTIRQLSSMFLSNEASQMSQLQAAARQKIEALKETSSLGLEYAAYNHSVFDVDIEIKEPVLILPYEGVMEQSSGKVVCSMGSFFFKSVELRKKKNETPRVSQLTRSGSIEDDILKEMTSLSYDKFSVGLQDVRIISVLPTEDWRVLVEQDNQDCFMLKPTSINMVIEKCLVFNDPRLPKLKVSGQLPSIHLDLVDTRLINTASVVMSLLSRTRNDIVTTHKVVTSAAAGIDLSAPHVSDDRGPGHSNDVSRMSTNEQGHPIQATELAVSFKIGDIQISLAEMQGEVVKPVGVFVVHNLDVTCAKKSSETVVDVTLQDLALFYVDHVGINQYLTLVECKDYVSDDPLSINFVNAEELSPEFHSRHQYVKKNLKVVIPCFAIDFHQEAILDLLRISKDIQSRIEAVSPSSQIAKPAPTSFNTAEPSLHPVNEDGKIAMEKVDIYVKTVDIRLHASPNEQPILSSRFSRVETKVDKNLITSALSVAVKVNDFTIDGPPSHNKTSNLVRPLNITHRNILDLIFETNPMDKSCDQRISLSVEPLLMTYDARTIRRMISAFQSNEASHSSSSLASIKSKLEALKEVSVLDLECAIRNHPIVDLDIKIKEPVLIIPYGGSMEPSRGQIVCNMDSFFIKSVELRKKNETSRLEHVMRIGNTENDILKEMMSLSYDKYSVGLQDVCVMSVLPTEDWRVLVEQDNQDCFILKPTSTNLKIEKCLVWNDPRLSKLKVSCQLPSIHLDLVETRLVNMAAVLKSIPSPTPNDTVSAHQVVATTDPQVDLSTPLIVCDDQALMNEQGQLVQATVLLMRFEFKDIRISLAVMQRDVLKPVGDFAIDDLKVIFTQKTFETSLDLKLQDLSLDYVDHVANNQKVTLIYRRDVSKDLLSINFVNVNKLSPEYSFRHKSMMKKLEVVVSSLAFDFHQEAVIDLLHILSDINSRIEAVSASADVANGPAPVSSNIAKPSLQPVKALADEGKEKKKKGGTDSGEDVDFQLIAQFDDFRVSMMNREKRLIEVTIGGLSVGTTVQTSHVVFHVGLDKFCAIDPSGTLYREIVTTVGGQTLHQASSQSSGGQVLEVDFTIFKAATEDDMNMNAVDYQIIGKISRLKAVYLSCFVQDLLAFITHCQDAIKVIVEASNHNLQQAYVQAPRVHLDIECQAPYIIVPPTPSSTDALIFDVGRLTIKNRFELRNVCNEIGLPAIMNSISFNVADLGIYFAVVDDELGSIQSETALTNSLTFSVGVLKNLSTPWYTDEPNLKVDVLLSKANITISQNVYEKVLKIVLDYLSKGQVSVGSAEQEGTAQPAENRVNDTAVEPISTENPLLPSSQSSELSAVTLLQCNAPTRVSIAITVTLTEFKVDLFANVKKGLSTDEQPLSRLSIAVLNASGQMMSDSSIQSKITLQSFSIDDTRPLLQTYSSSSTGSTPTSPTMSLPKSSSLKQIGEKPITRLLYSTESELDNPLKQMLIINFEKSKERHSAVTIHLSGFTLILYPNYFLQVLDFFTAGLPSTASRGQTPSTEGVLSAHQTSSNSSLMTIVLMVDRPDIFLLERFDSLNTNALAFNMEMKLTVGISIPLLELLKKPKTEMLDQIPVISAEVSNLQIYSCQFDPAARQSTRATVLSPCHLTITREQSSQVYVNIDNVTLSVSPGTIEILLNLIDTVTERPSSSRRKIHHPMWKERPLKDFDFPFLATEITQEANEPVIHENDQLEKKQPRNEKMILVVANFTIEVEIDQANRTRPLVLLESKITANFINWSSELEVEATLSLQVAYYNSHLALWEPVLEPVKCARTGNQRPVELTMHLKKIIASAATKSSKLEIKFKSADNMELTITRSFLDVVSILIPDISDALKQRLTKRELWRSCGAARYVVQNHLDKAVVLDLANGDFILDDGSLSNSEAFILEPNSKIDVKENPQILSVFNEEENEIERQLWVEIPQLSYSSYIPVGRPCRRFLQARHQTETGQENIGIVAEISNDLNSRSVTFRGVVQVENHFQTAIDVHIKTGNQVNKVGRVEESGVLNLPLDALYTPSGELFFSSDGYSVSNTPIAWRDLHKQETISKLLVCNPHQISSSMAISGPFFIQATGKVEKIFLEDSRKKTNNSVCYDIHLRPAVILHNSLPLPLRALASGTNDVIEVFPGGSSSLSFVDPAGSSSIVLKFTNRNRDWTCKGKIRHSPQKTADVWVFKPNHVESAKISILNLEVLYEVKDQTLYMTVYCPFWMINNTGLSLTYKDGVFVNQPLYHPTDLTEPVLFSPRPTITGQKTVQVRVKGSGWSNPFSLNKDCNSGIVTCEGGGNRSADFCQLGVTVQLCNEGLTTQIILTPYCVLSNLAPYDIEVCEVNEVDPKSLTIQHDWIQVISGQSVPFWPHRSSQTKKQIKFRVGGTTQETLALSLEELKPTVLRLDNGYGGISIDVQVSDSSMVVVCRPYEDGGVPIMLVNHTAEPVMIHKRKDGSSSLVAKLSNQHARYYILRNVNASRSLTWGSEGGRKPVRGRDVLQSGTGTFEDQGGQSIHWVSFLHDQQRILLFTTDKSLPNRLQSNATASEPVKQSVSVLFPKVGVSLVDNIRRLEILYAEITSSGVMWETAEITESPTYRPTIRSSLLEKLYEQYLLELQTDPNASSRRELDSGAFVVDFKENRIYKPDERHIRRSYDPFGVKVIFENSSNRRRIYTRLSKVQIDNQLENGIFRTILAPVPTLSVEPFAELNVIWLIGASLSVGVQRYEQFKLLLQESQICLAPSLVYALTDLVYTRRQQSIDFDLKSATLAQALGSNYFELLHLSQWKLHLRLSIPGMTDAITDATKHALSSPVTQLLNSVIPKTGLLVSEHVEVDGAVVRLKSFEQNCGFLSWNQIASRVGSNISYHVGVLPGVQSLYKTIGNNSAYLTFDKKYQKDRREKNRRRSIAHSRTTEGAKQQGAVGFFKVLGKGAVGLVARPATAFLDFVSGAMDSVINRSEVTTKRLRPPRFLHPDRIVRTYDYMESYMNFVVETLKEGRFSKSDHYVDHADIFTVDDETRMTVLLVTNLRLMLLSSSRKDEKWKIEWAHAWEELNGAPQALSKKLYLSLRNGDNCKLVPFECQEDCEDMRLTIEEQMNCHLIGQVSHC